MRIWVIIPKNIDPKGCKMIVDLSPRLIKLGLSSDIYEIDLKNLKYLTSLETVFRQPLVPKYTIGQKVHYVQSEMIVKFIEPSEVNGNWKIKYILTDPTNGEYEVFEEDKIFQ